MARTPSIILRVCPLEDRLAPAGLDPTFGGDGAVELPFIREARDLTALSDGRLLVLSGSLIRLAGDGSEDVGFGTEGRTTFGVDTTDVAVTASGRLVVVGIGAADGQEFPVLYLLDADGRGDTESGAAAHRITVGPLTGLPTDRAVFAVAAPDGGVYVVTAGLPDPDQGLDTTIPRIGVAKLRADGLPDPAFGEGGAVTVGTEAGFDPSQAGFGLGVSAVAVDADGRLLVAGTSVPAAAPDDPAGDTGSRPFVFRLTAAGPLDPTFAGDGVADVRAPDRAVTPAAAGVPIRESAVAVTDLDVTPAGRVLVSVRDTRQAISLGIQPDVPRFPPRDVVVALTPAGRTDAGFGDGGSVVIVEEFTSPTAVGPDGSLAFITLRPGDTRATLYRLSPSGKPAGREPIDEAVDRLAESVYPSAYALTADATGRLTAEFIGGTGPVRPRTSYHLVRPADRLPLPTPRALVGGAGGRLGQITTSSEGELLPGVGGEVVPFSDFSGAVRGAVADLNADGRPDFLFGVGPAGGSRVRVQLAGDGATAAPAPIEFSAFEPSFTGGIYVTTGDLTGDGVPDLIVTPDVGGGPVVAVYDGAKLAAEQAAGAEVRRFFGIDDPAFRGGARAAVGDTDGDGQDDLIVAAGVGGGPRVAVYDGNSVGGTLARLRPDFFAFPGEDATRLRNGATVSAGDLDGDGKAELAFGSGAGGAPRVRVLSGDTVRADFFAAGDVTSRAGSNVAVRDVSGDGEMAVLVGAGGRVRVYPADQLAPGAEPDTSADLAFPADPTTGVFVG